MRGSSARNVRGLTVRDRQLLGDMIWLMLQSVRQRSRWLADLDHIATPALLHRQVSFYARRGKLIGFATWARCTEKVDVHLAAGDDEPAGLLGFDDWVSGDRYWLVSLVAPLSDRAPYLRDAMIAELALGPLRGHNLKVRYGDDADNVRLIQTIDQPLAHAILERWSTGIMIVPTDLDADIVPFGRNDRRTRTARPLL